jgi:hypothetical protein
LHGYSALNFLICYLQLHDGIKKSGIMGFYDPCPGDPKLLLVEYTFHGHKYKVGNAVTLPYVPACDKRRKFFFFHEQVFLTACLLC